MATMRAGVGGQMRRGWLWPLLCVVALAAGCASAAPTSVGKSATVASTATAPDGGGVSTVVSTITPVPGTYSLYIDPTWGYSFQYPSSWTPVPAAGNEESNVIITAPYDPSPAHSMLKLLVRVTPNFQHAFVQQLICARSKTTTVAGYPAVNLDTDGGDPIVGYSAVALSRAFFAKGLAFWIWLQGSDKSSAEFVKANQPYFNQVLATFNVGNGAKTTASC